VTRGAEPVALRVMTPDDIPDGLRLSAAAGWNQTGEDWRFLLSRNPGRFVVALRGTRVIGSGGAVCYGSALAWVCMILVDPEARGHGIGTQIVQGVLDRLTDLSAVGLDATPHGQGVYARLGFVETSRLLRVEAAGPAADGRPEPRRTDVASVRTIDAGDFDRILDVDLRVFGANRADLLRLAARQAPARCRVDDAGAIVGYCFGRRGSRSRQIGPVVARDAATARALVSAAMHAEPGGRVVLDVPAARADWLAMLEEMGFAVQRPLVRMFRASRPPGHPSRQWAIFGPEFG
jgi:GNAT superfamily N-acetyltransferase